MTTRTDDLDPKMLCDLLVYDPATGNLFWRRRPKEMFSSVREHNRWNTRYAGQRALICVNKTGYCAGHVMNFSVLAHRVIWAMQTGKWPRGEIDHINGNRSDNRWSNLRVVTRNQNMQNKNPTSGSTSKYLGVGWHKASASWVAQIACNGRKIHIGCFKTESDAAMAYDAEKIKFGPNVRLNFPARQHKDENDGR